MSKAKREYLTKELFKIKLEEWYQQIQEKAEKVIRKKVELNRYFVLYSGFQKTTSYKLKNLTVGELNEIRQLYFMKLPNPRPLSIADDMPTPDFNENLSFYLDKAMVDEQKNKIVVDLFYKQDF